jgi:putative membrane protein
VIELLKNYGRGLLMGVADVVPGVSGGTMALIVGIYERLVASVSHFFQAAVAAVSDHVAIRIHLRAVDWGLVIPLALGVGTALLLGARRIPDLLELYPQQGYGLFFGLILASLAIPWLRLRTRSWIAVAVAAIAAPVAFLLVGLPQADIPDPGPIRIMLSASIAICAMILPGVSGSFILVVLGIYSASLRAIAEFDLGYIGLFVLGAIVGLGVFSRLLTWLLTRIHDITMAALLGLMAGSLRALWPWQTIDRSLRMPLAGDPVMEVLIFFFIGFLFVAGLTWWGHTRVQEGGDTSID